MSDVGQQNAVPVCPIPSDDDRERITLAYGEGGRLTRQLIRERILTRFANDQLNALGDAALLMPGSRRLAFSTDGFTVTPLFFPGGDIGKLAVFGTTNDLVVSGAIPRWLSLSLIIEEGLPWSVLDRVLDSIQDAAAVANVTIVTGDTKVVPHGAADKLFITTSGLGEVMESAPIGPRSLQPDDALIISGPIGRHGAAILCAREKFDFDPLPTSDCACLSQPLISLYAEGLTPRAVRDATRGGVAAVLHEWADASELTCIINESAIPVADSVRGVCELLGLDLVNFANEGTFVLATQPELVESTLNLLRQHAVTHQATVIGRVKPRRNSPVLVVRGIGREVVLDEPSGSPLPRIC
ncbi:MAG: hydrogenase expression/formation protein HypE [Schlesneria sp.]